MLEVLPSRKDVAPLSSQKEGKDETTEENQDEKQNEDCATTKENAT